MKKITLFTILSAAVLANSCGLYNKYERPDVNAEGIVRDAVSPTDTLAVTDTASFGNMPWRDVFTDPQLQTLISQGLERNTDLLNAALNVKMIEAQLTASKLAFLPSIAFAPSGTLSSWDGSKTSKTYQLPVSASWSVDLFGNLLSQKRSAQMQLLAAKDYQTAVKTNVIAGIANLYYTLLMLDKQMEIVDSMTVLTKETWDMMALQMRYGRARSTSVQSAEASYYSVLAQASTLRQQIRETENSLSLLVCQPGQAIPRGELHSLSASPSRCSPTAPTSTRRRCSSQPASTMCRRHAAASIPHSTSPPTASSLTAAAWASPTPAPGSSPPSAASHSPSSRTAG